MNPVRLLQSKNKLANDVNLALTSELGFVMRWVSFPRVNSPNGGKSAGRQTSGLTHGACAVRVRVSVYNWHKALPSSLPTQYMYQCCAAVCCMAVMLGWADDPPWQSTARRGGSPGNPAAQRAQPLTERRVDATVTLWALSSFSALWRLGLRSSNNDTNEKTRVVFRPSQALSCSGLYHLPTSTKQSKAKEVFSLCALQLT